MSLLRASFTNPGSIPAGWNDNMEQKAFKAYDIYKGNDSSQGLYRYKVMTIQYLLAEIEKDIDVKNELKDRGFRPCKFCLKFKPPRTHHCRQCGKCVLKMTSKSETFSLCISFKTNK